MSIRATTTGIKVTWDLFWGQRLGRALTAILAVFVAVYLFEFGSDAFRAQLTSHLDRLILPGLIILLVLRTREAEGIEERRFWNFIALGMIVWLAGSTFTFLARRTGSTPWTELATEVLYFGLYLCWFLACDQQPQLESGWSKRDVLYRFSLVGATLFIVIMFGYFIVVPWATQQSEMSQYFSSFNLYVTLDSFLAVRFTLLFTAARAERWRRTFALMAGVTAVMAVGDLLEGLGFADILATVVGGRIDMIWLVSHSMIAVMILTCADRSGAGDEIEAGSAPRIQSLLPFYAFSLPLVHLGLYLLGHLDPQAQAPRQAIVFLGLVLFAVLSLAQQISLERAVESLQSELTVRALGDKLRQSQRLESIGRLAGGIAHDFNNLLMVIKSYAELALRQEPAPDPQVRDKLTEIDRATNRAADLVRQLLAFGRRQVIKPEVVNVNELVLGLEGMLSRIIGDDIELRVELDGEAGFTRVDPALLEQVIVNLVVNARDAMPRGGTVVIATGSIRPHGEHDTEERWVDLTVSDTGIGIDPAIRDRIFEPYFTTKEMEKGTGLGLATVYGITEQSGGVIEVESEPGKGTTFRVRLAQVEGPPIEVSATVPRPVRSVEGETVLLTEDESNIREALAEYLVSLGLVVLQAEDGVDALAVADGYNGEIGLLVTDLVMPRMSGPELAQRLLAKRADLKVIYVSGYTPEAMQEYGGVGAGTTFLQKPFHLGDLANTIRDLLEE